MNEHRYNTECEERTQKRCCTVITLMTRYCKLYEDPQSPYNCKGVTNPPTHARIHAYVCETTPRLGAATIYYKNAHNYNGLR